MEEPEDFREEVDAARTAMVAVLSKADGVPIFRTVGCECA